MERAEKLGLGVAALGHVALFVLLSLGLFSARIPKPPLADTMDVTIADAVGMKSAATEVSQEAPKASQAPEIGKPEDSAPPPPAPEPEPTPPPPAPAPKPVPPKPTPKPVAKPEPKPEPKPVPKPTPKPAPEKPKPTPEKPKPEKPAPDKAKPDKAKPDKAKPTEASSSAKPTTKPTQSKKAPGLPSDFLKDLPKETGAGKDKADAKPKGSRLGADFLKGIGSDAKGTADKPRAAEVSPRAMAGLAAMIAAQVKPCYNPPAGGADSGAIVTVLNLRMNKDGSVGSVTAGEQTGVNAANSAYARQMADAARRAVLRCAPLKLPPELYTGGWDDFGFRFKPEQMQ